MKFMIIFCVMTVTVIYILNRLYKKTNHYKNSIWQIEKFKHVPEEIEIAAIGSGPGLYDITFSNCPKKGFNFCLGPQSLEYGYKILKQYQNKLKSGCILIITIGPLSFSKNSSYNNKNYSDSYYHFLSHSQITNYSVIHAFLLKFPLVIHPKRVVKIIKDIPYNDFHTVKQLNEQEMRESVRTGIAIWKQQANLKDLQNEKQSLEHQEAFREKRRYLKEILSLCKKNCWKPIFVIMPMNEGIQKQISREFETEFVIKQIEQVNSAQIPVLNYFRDNYFSRNHFYLSCFFMNSKGRKEFSNKLFSDIEQILQNKN